MDKSPYKGRTLTILSYPKGPPLIPLLVTLAIEFLMHDICGSQYSLPYSSCSIRLQSEALDIKSDKEV